ncbi:hypothetical protein D5086_030751 [Populus alba]|uniref:Uncharacterized protein n=1 Tax=Populus alba TaxID=43335 RepID=A0ACC4APM6_POPAL
MSSSSSSKYLSLTNLSLFAPLHLSFLFLHLTILVTGGLPPPYVPLDNIALDCGSSADSFGNDRNWTADINSKVALLDQGSPSTNLTANGASTSSVPYYTARVSLSQFTYTFPVTTTGPKFVRLYFNPASYTGFNRNMGPNVTINEEYNMTWEFPVHSTFTYFVRLHFYIISWADGNGVPIYKDYGVMMHARGIEEVQNLSIALHPSPQSFSFSDAMLNGVEIFKLSKSDNLSGPNPGVYQDSPISNTPPSTTSTKPTHSRRGIVTIIEGAEEYVIGAQSEKEDDMETPLKGSSIDDSSDLFSTGSELVVNSRILEMATTSSSDGQSFLSNESEKMMSGAVFSEIMNPKGR